MLRLFFFLFLSAEMLSAQDLTAYLLEKSLSGKSIQFLYSRKKEDSSLLYGRVFFEFEKLPVFLGTGFGQVKKTAVSENILQFIEKKENVGRAVSGFSFHSLSAYAGKEYRNRESSILGIQFRLFSGKKIQYEQTWNEGFKRDALLLQSGNDIQLGLNFFRTEDSSRNFTEKGGSVSVTLNFDFFSASAGALFGSSDWKETVFLSASVHQNGKETALLSEQNVFEPISSDRPENEERIPEKKPAPPPKDNEKKPVILTLQELLARKIPLGEAARIAEASKDPKKLKALLEILPKDTRGKVHFLLKEKKSK